MKILLVHNFYGSSAPSGENKVFEAEKAMLERHGHEVMVYARHSDEIRVVSGQWLVVRAKKAWGMAKGALCTIGNPFAARAVARRCREFKPDVVHFHNTFPLISPLAIRAASKHAPVVMTLHNYRTACAAGVPTRDGKVCSLCLDKRCVFDGIKHRCYRGGLLATLPLAINITLYRRLLPRWVSRFIVLSGFQRRKMADYGWPEEKIVVKGNFVSGGIESGGVGIKKNQFVYVGRLSPEKGVETLIEAWRLMGRDAPPLLIIGDGDSRMEYKHSAEGLPISFLGKQPNEEVRKMMEQSKAVVLPSECWEGMPITILESFAEGVPCIVSNLGALPEYVRNGELGEVFEAGNADSLAAAVKRLLSRPDYTELCAAAQREAARKYSESANYARLLDIYAEATT